MEKLRNRYTRASLAERNLWAFSALTIVVILQLCALIVINP